LGGRRPPHIEVNSSGLWGMEARGRSAALPLEGVGKRGAGRENWPISVKENLSLACTQSARRNSPRSVSRLLTRMVSGSWLTKFGPEPVWWMPWIASVEGHSVLVGRKRSNSLQARKKKNWGLSCSIFTRVSLSGLGWRRNWLRSTGGALRRIISSYLSADGRAGHGRAAGHGSPCCSPYKPIFTLRQTTAGRRLH